MSTHCNHYNQARQLTFITITIEMEFNYKMLIHVFYTMLIDKQRTRQIYRKVKEIDKSIDK